MNKVTKISRSKKVVVLIEAGPFLGLYILNTKSEDGAEKTLEIDTYRSRFEASQKNETIDLLVNCGMSVRFYDSEEKQWMQANKSIGSIRVDGNRDGTWSPPSSYKDFEKDYLFRAE